MPESPIFITGLPRTGKTALRRALGAHPELSLTRKTGLWKSFFGRFGDLNDPASLERCLTAILGDPGAARLLPDAGRIRQEFANRDRTYPELFGVFHAEYARRMNKSRWGEQAAYLEQYADPIYETWPDSRMIHMVRYPSDWVASGAQRRPGGVARELAKWTTSAQLALDNRARFGDNYLIVRFERLRSDPAPVLQEISAFIGEEINFGMSQTLVALLPADPGSQLVPAARRYVEKAVGATAQQLGYSSEASLNGSGVSRLLAHLWFGAGRLRFTRP